jgi:hypothetical protein
MEYIKLTFLLSPFCWCWCQYLHYVASDDLSIWKDLEASIPDLLKVSAQHLHGKTEKKLWGTFVKIATVPAEIQTKHLKNIIILENYLQTNVFNDPFLNFHSPMAHHTNSINIYLLFRMQPSNITYISINRKLSHPVFNKLMASLWENIWRTQ